MGHPQPWSHVGVAYRLEDLDRVMVLECVARAGVRVVPMSSFVKRSSLGTEPFPGRIVVARHEGLSAKSRKAPWKKMAEFGFDRLGDKFSSHEMAKIALRIVLGRFDVRLPPSLGPDDEFICSEYVARCYKEIDLEFPWDGLGFLAPADIARAPRVAAIAQIKTGDPGPPGKGS